MSRNVFKFAFAIAIFLVLASDFSHRVILVVLALFSDLIDVLIIAFKRIQSGLNQAVN